MVKRSVARGRRLVSRLSETVPARVLTKFGADQGANQAVVIAWNMLMAFFPIVLALAAIAGLVLGHVGIAAQAQIESVALSRLPQSPQDTAAALDALKQQSGLLFVVGLAGLIWSGSSLFGAMEQAFDRIFELPSRGFVQQKVMGVSMMLLFAALAAMIVLSTSALALVKQLPLPAPIAGSAGVYVLQPLFGVLAGVVLFGAMYYVVPNRRQRAAETWPGALLAGAGFYGLTLAFPLYIRIAGGGMNKYGSSFAFLFIVMTFFYFIGLITMLGAELNAVLFPAPPAAGGAPARRPAPPPDGPEGPVGSRPRHGGRRPALQRVAFGLAGAAIGTLAFIRAGRRGG